MSRDTLSTLELHEKPGQRVWLIRRVPHYQVDGAVDVQPGERVFAIGAAHHDVHVVMVETEEKLSSVGDNHRTK